MNRDEIINHYEKNKFRDFLEYDTTGQTLQLFDVEGINILNKSHLKEERICYILNFSKYKNQLLQNPLFLDMFLKSHINDYYASLYGLDFITYDLLIQRSNELNLNYETIATLFSYFDLEYKLQKIKNWPYSKEILYSILQKDIPPVVQKIIENHNIDLLSHDICLREFFSTAKESVLKSQAKRNTENIIYDCINIPVSMITKEMAEKIWNEYNIFEIRAIINDAQYCTDISTINNYVKQMENDIIYNYNSSTLLSPFKDIYEAFKNFKFFEKEYDSIRFNWNNSLEHQKIEDSFYESRQNFLKLLNKFDCTEYYHEFNKLYEQNGLQPINEYLKKLSDNSLSNYIIDYLFEENFHNIMIDIRELLDFYYRGNIVIPKERIEIYETIANIDYLSLNEKKALYLELKNFNIIETFYDDMAFARHIVSEAIKEYSLSSSTITQYKNENLSKEYGIDVYTVNGEPFFGIVKTGRRLDDKLPTGHSYSLIGDEAITVFGDPKDSDTYLYDSDDMNPEQLVHAFPYDSYTLYHPFEYSEKATTRVNTLLMPDEILKKSATYTELLILEKGRKSTDIDESIPKLKKIALYCLDEIRQQDIEIAKANNVGIFLINSKKYVKPKTVEKSYDFGGICHFEYDYFNGWYEKEKFEARR